MVDELIHRGWLLNHTWLIDAKNGWKIVGKVTVNLWKLPRLLG